MTSKAMDTRASAVGVSLSNPQMSQSRRKMLDLVNRLHSTGYVSVLERIILLINKWGIVSKLISICLKSRLSDLKVRENRPS